MTSPEVRDAVRDVLAGIVGSDVAGRISDDDRIFEGRIIDSLHVIELVERLEQRFAREIGPDELTPENFESVSAMATFLGSPSAG
jgi:acyl carrier protein